MKNTIKASVWRLRFWRSRVSGHMLRLRELFSGAITLSATVLTDDAVDCTATGGVTSAARLFKAARVWPKGFPAS